MSRVVRGAQLLNVPPVQWVIDHWMPADSIGLLYGPPESGKSWVGMDIGLDLATDNTDVLYIAAERERLLTERALGWARRHGLKHPPDQFAILAGNPQLTKPSGRDEIHDAIDEVRPRVVIIDTLAQVTVGMRENDGGDWGMVVYELDAIRRHLADIHPDGGVVMPVHHSGKNLEAGARGHSVLFGRLDFEIRVSKTGDRVTMAVTKLNAAPHPKARTFILADGALTPTGSGSDEPTISRAEQAYDCIVAAGGSITPGDLARDMGVDAKTAKRAAESHPGIRDNQAAGRARRWIITNQEDT